MDEKEMKADAASKTELEDLKLELHELRHNFNNCHQQLVSKIDSLAGKSQAPPAIPPGIMQLEIIFDKRQLMIVD